MSHRTAHLQDGEFAPRLDRVLPACGLWVLLLWALFIARISRGRTIRYSSSRDPAWSASYGRWPSCGTAINLQLTGAADIARDCREQPAGGEIPPPGTSLAVLLMAGNDHPVRQRPTRPDGDGDALLEGATCIRGRGTSSFKCLHRDGRAICLLSRVISRARWTLRHSPAGRGDRVSGAVRAHPIGLCFHLQALRRWVPDDTRLEAPESMRAMSRQRTQRHPADGSGGF